MEGMSGEDSEGTDQTTAPLTNHYAAEKITQRPVFLDLVVSDCW